MPWVPCPPPWCCLQASYAWWCQIFAQRRQMRWLEGGLQLASSDQRLLCLGTRSLCVSSEERCVCSELGCSLSFCHFGFPSASRLFFVEHSHRPRPRRRSYFVSSAPSASTSRTRPWPGASTLSWVTRRRPRVSPPFRKLAVRARPARRHLFFFSYAYWFCLSLRVHRHCGRGCRA